MNEIRVFPVFDILLSARRELFDYFDYIEDWRVLPVEDSREYHWKIIGSEKTGSVRYHQHPSNLLPESEDEGNYYENEIYAQRHLKKFVYRGSAFTMISVDTQTDGNQFLRIFDNSKEVK